MFLLDTNAASAWLARRNRLVMLRASENHDRLMLSMITLHELFFGAFNTADPSRYLPSFERLDIPILDFHRSDAHAAGEIRAKLKRAGTPIGPYDLLIAGQALARDLVLVTNNVREFSRVDGLKLEDWTAA